MTHKVSPAEYVIEQFGGVGKTARALGIWKGSVSKWRSSKKPPNKRLVPAQHHKKILDIAKEQNLNIKAEHFIYIG